MAAGVIRPKKTVADVVFVGHQNKMLVNVDVVMF